MELLKLLERKLLKTSLFSFKTFIGISELCDALVTSSFKIFVEFVSVSLNKMETSPILTFVLNCSNAWVVSLFQNCF